MREMSRAIKSFSDVVLILAWMYIIGNGLSYNFWLILVSIIFWFGYDLTESIKENNTSNDLPHI